MSRRRIASSAPRAATAISVVFFLDPNPEALVACLPTCLKDGAAKYPPVVAADYLLSRLEPTYAHKAVIPTGAERSSEASSR